MMMALHFKLLCTKLDLVHALHRPLLSITLQLKWTLLHRPPLYWFNWAHNIDMEWNILGVFSVALVDLRLLSSSSRVSRKCNCSWLTRVKSRYMPPCLSIDWTSSIHPSIIYILIQIPCIPPRGNPSTSSFSDYSGTDGDIKFHAFINKFLTETRSAAIAKEEEKEWDRERRPPRKSFAKFKIL